MRSGDAVVLSPLVVASDASPESRAVAAAQTKSRSNNRDEFDDPGDNRPGAGWSPRRKTRLAPYLLAMLAIAFCTAVTVWVPPLKANTSLSLLFAAVVVSCYLGGRGPAWFSIVLSAVAWATFIVPPEMTMRMSGSDTFRLVLFMLVAVLTCTLMEQLAGTKRELRKQSRRLDLALEAGRMGVWDYDLVRDEFWISPELREIFGIQEAEFSPTYGGFLSFVHPDDRAAVVRAMTTSRENRTDYQIEHRLQLRDNRVRRIATRGRTFVDAQGRAERMIGLVVDITNEPAHQPTGAGGDEVAAA